MLLIELLFLQGLAITVLTECCTAWLLYRWLGPQIHISHYLFVVGCASVLTLPYFWFVLPAAGLPWMWYVLIGEASIILIEAIFCGVLLRMSWYKAIVLALAMNIVSIGLGYVWTTFVL